MQTDPAELKALFEPKEVRSLKNTRQICSARYTPCGKFLIGGGFDGLVHRWDCTQDEHPELPALEGHNGWVQEVAIEPGGQAFLSVDSWGALRSWSLTEEPCKLRWELPAAHDGWITSLAINNDGSLCATTGHDRKVRVWKTADGALVHEFETHAVEVFKVAFHPGGKFLVSGDLHGKVFQWDLETKASVREFDASILFKEHRLQDVGGVRCLQFDAAGTRLAVGGTQPANGGNVQGIPTVLIYDWESGELKQTVELGKSGDVYPYDLFFHPAGFLISILSGNPGAGKLIYRQLDAEAPFFETTKMANCHSMSVHPDGLRLAIVATNGGSNGNGRRVDKDGNYEGNWSPIYLLDMPAPTPAEPATEEATPDAATPAP